MMRHRQTDGYDSLREFHDRGQEFQKRATVQNKTNCESRFLRGIDKETSPRGEGRVDLQVAVPSLSCNFERDSFLTDLILKDKVAFHEDWIEQVYAQDYVRLFSRPFIPQREDWGGAYYSYGTKLPPEELFRQKKIHNLKYKQELDRNDHDAIQEDTPSQVVEAEEELPPKTKRLPSIFEKEFKPKRRNARECTVSTERLLTFGHMIDDLTRFPLIHM
ncbi:hypothetical protein IE077_002424, partial [Cardiosporidium cionae]